MTKSTTSSDPTSPSSAEVSSPSAKSRWPQYSIAHLLEFLLCLGIILAISRVFHWIPGILVALLALIVFVVNSRFGSWSAGSQRKHRSGMTLSFLLAFIFWATYLLFEWQFKKFFNGWQEMAGHILLLGIATFNIGTASWLIGRRRYDAFILFIVLCPLTFWFARGFWDYAHGNAVLPAKIGWPWQATTDPVTRLWRDTKEGYGFFHLPRGDEWIHEIPYENALIIATQMFGPMRGTYAGPYPTEAQAREALRKAEIVTPDERGVIVLDGQKIFLEGLLGDMPRSIPGRSPPVLFATAWQHECIVVGVQPPGADQIYSIYLYSRSTGRKFAHYGN
jgi:hypothetical protein